MLAVMFGHWEIIAILLIALLLFGKRLPSVMRSVGKSVTQFKKGLRDVEGEINSAGEGDEEDDTEDHPPHPAG
ncbi:MAG: Sec-independent protein translocase subunit TatA/TatB [Planctomycetota bacterium]